MKKKDTITQETIDYIARLAHIRPSKDDLSRLTQNVSNILDYMTILNEVDTKGVSSMSHTLDICNAFRTDEIKDFPNKEDIVKNFPKKEKNLLKIPKVI